MQTWTGPLHKPCEWDTPIKLDAKKWKCGRLRPTASRSYYFPACIPRSFAQTLALLRRSSLYGAVSRKLSRPFLISNVSPPCPSSSVCLHRLGYCWAYAPNRFFKSVLWVCTSMILLCSSKKIPVVFCRFVSPVRIKPPGFKIFFHLLSRKIALIF